ncbi:MAG: response regulator [Sulfuritalea sp.]|jgi:CheY-like chemotaxis protein|nr:response regulator [Sulfuritalea sp.]
MSHKTRILIVDDDPDMRKLLRLALDHARREIHEADTALGGLQLARDTMPDIVLLDIGLPGRFDGFTLCEALVREPAFRDVKVVIISGHNASEDLDRAGRLGVEAYVVKPLSPGTLVELVEQLEIPSHEMRVVGVAPGLADPADQPA